MKEKTMYSSFGELYIVVIEWGVVEKEYGNKIFV